MKKINIVLKDKENLIFELAEDAKKGDFFSIKELNEIDFSILNDFIEEKNNEFIERKIKEKSKFAVLEYKNSEEFNLLKETSNQNYKLKNELKQLEEFHKKEVDSIKNSFYKNAFLEAELKFSKEIKQFENNLNNLKQEKDFQEKKFKFEKQSLEDKLNLQKQLELNNLKNILSDEISKLELEKQNSINNLKNEINEIKREKTINSKLIGEDLERWIIDQYNTYLDLAFSDSTLIKANEIIEGTKPDFIFTTFDKDNSKLVSVTIEAKSQSFFSESNKKKNSFFYEKLDKDRNKNKTEFALLISELEPENNFSILKVKEYEDMYVIRPEYFVSFISLVRTIATKRKEINKSVLNFKEKQKIIDEFEKEKTDILNNSLKNLQKNLDEIDKQANSIITSANRILETKRTASDAHITTVKNKIENFSILKPKKISEIHEINKYENNLESQSKISKNILNEKDLKH